jgi:hypothetical protein
LIVERDFLPASENPSSENKTATYVADTFWISQLVQRRVVDHPQLAP